MICASLIAIRPLLIKHMPSIFGSKPSQARTQEGNVISSFSWRQRVKSKFGRNPGSGYSHELSSSQKSFNKGPEVKIESEDGSGENMAGGNGGLRVYEENELEIR